MYMLLLAIIYIAFIGLGLPDSLLGAGWPVMQTDFDVPLSYAGIVSMIIAGGTIVSSLLSDFLTKKLGAGLVTAISVGMTAISLFGFSIAPSFIVVCIWAVPYGLGAGAVDAALNNYVALHYSSRHMSWLHAFWGLGVSVSPYVMSYSLMKGFGWENGYRSIFFVQIIISAALFMSLPLWKRRVTEKNDNKGEKVSAENIFAIKGVPFCLLAFFLYCAFESTAGLWATSYMVMDRGIDEETAASFAALYFMGITSGRFISGFIADKLSDKTMVKAGILGMIVGAAITVIPFGTSTFAVVGLVVMGLGSAPVYPCIIHSTPKNFGEENSQALVGIQMASAYVGSTFMPLIFGFLAEKTTISIYPLFLLVAAVLVLVMTENMNKNTENGEEAK